jgi:PIN domain nuclease of toxin-antitoxin system
LKGYLLDTSVALRAVSTPEILPARVLKAIGHGPAFLSVIACWEVMLKSMKGSLDVGDPRVWFGETLDALGLSALLFRPGHIAAIFPLEPLHQDPFDRALIAQATAEDLTLLTTDATISRYVSRDFRVIR